MRKYENFCNALSNMKDIYNYEEPYDNVVITGLVGLYEICFEQSWKMMKEILEIHGYAEGATDSPKIILKTAYKAGMIRDEEQWLRALQARNNVTHSYNRKIASGITAIEIKKDKKIKHHRNLCYESSNTKVVTVTSDGVIKAMRKGNCKIWVYAQNGVYKVITVTVK